MHPKAGALGRVSDYATIRSIIDTSRKRGLNEFESLVKVVSGVGVFGGE